MPLGEMSWRRKICCVESLGSPEILSNCLMQKFFLEHRWNPREQGSWGQHGAHLGPVVPRWAPWWPHWTLLSGMSLNDTPQRKHVGTNPRIHLPLLYSTCVNLEKCSLQWRHNGHDSVSNHQPHDCLLNRLFRRRSKKALKLRVSGLCAGNSPETGEFPAQMVSNAKNVSIWWRHIESIKTTSIGRC